jgi:hypothetical protein
MWLGAWIRKNLGSSGFTVVLGVGAAAPTPKTTKIPNEPKSFPGLG